MRETQATPSVVLRSFLFGFLCAIGVLSFVSAPDAWVIFLFAGLVFFFTHKLSDRTVHASLLLLIFFLSGAMLGAYGVERSEPTGDSIAAIQPASYRVQGTVVQSRVSGSRQQLTLTDLEVDETSMQDRVLVFAPVFPEFDYGDRITVRCNLDQPDPFDGFAYDRFLAAKSIYATCFSASSPFLVDVRQGHPLKQVLWPVREAVIKRIDVTFGEPHGSLLAGLLLGEQRFSEGWQDVFQKTGTTHIVAASGYNVTIVVFLLFGALTYAGVKRQQAFWLLLVGIVAYVVMAGAESAIIRAGLMGSVVLLSRQLGRKAGMANIILITAVVMLAANPKLLRDDIGFQLSMLSTIALVYIAPLLEGKLRFVPETFGLRESLAATISATLFTLPVVFFSFGTVSLIGPVANLFVLPIVPYAMLLGAIVIGVSFLSVPLASFIAGPAWALLSTVLFTVKSLSAIPFASISVPGSLMLPLALSSSLLILYLWRHSVKKTSVPLSL